MLSVSCIEQNMDENVSKNISINTIKQDIVKCDIILKRYLEEIRNHNGNERELNELAAATKNKYNQMRRHLDCLRSIVQEHVKAGDRAELLQDVERHEHALHHIHATLRSALGRAQLALREREKNELFSFSGRPPGEEVFGVRPRMNKELALKQSTQLTEDLLSVTRMIQENTEKSSKTLDKLVESSETISSTREELKTMSSVINQAKKVLNKYGRRENTDKLLIFLGLIFFVACCLVVIRKRLNLF